MKFSRVARLLTAALLVAASTVQADPAREWTVMGYFVSDDNKSGSLEESQFRNFEELISRGSGASHDLVMQIDRGNKTTDYLQSRYSDPNYSGMKRYHVGKGGTTVVDKPGEVNMGDPDTLLDFMSWAAATYPAKRYLLVINAHGSGTLSWRGVGSTSDPQPGRVVMRPRQYVAYDDTDDDCLTMFELAAVLEAFAAKSNGGRKLDVIAMDSCLTATVEALYQLRDGVDLLVGSASTIPGHGFRYTAIVDAIAQNPAIDPETLAGVITKSFIDRADSGNVLGAFRTSKAEELVETVSQLGREMHAAGQEVGKFAVRDLTTYGGSELYWDLDRVASAIESGNTGATGARNAAAMADAARKVRLALRSARASMWYSGNFAEKKVGGLSILWPATDAYLKNRNFYKATAFAKASLWDEFLDWRQSR